MSWYVVRSERGHRVLVRAKEEASACRAIGSRWHRFGIQVDHVSAEPASPRDIRLHLRSVPGDEEHHGLTD
jgi:hypothetical protein